MQTWFIAYFSDIGNSCYGQLTAVKTMYPLTSITWPYRELELELIDKVDSWPSVVFGWIVGSCQINLQPRSQGPPSYRPLGRARSRATMTFENIREGSSLIRQFVAFNGSLRAESSNSIYSTVYVKVRQVCLETIYRGRDVVAVIPIGFMESRSYLNCGCRAAHDSY